MSQVTQEQIAEWTENPVTLALKSIAEYERDELEKNKGLGAFHPFDAQKTQEILANLNGAVETWDFVIAALEGEGLWEVEDE